MQEFYHTICLINDSPAHTLIGSCTKPFHQPGSPQIALQVPCLHFLKQSLTISTDSDPENCFHSNRDQKKFNTSLRRSRLSEILFPRAANKSFLIQSWTNPLGKKKIWFRNRNRSPENSRLDSVRKRDGSPHGTTKLRETETPGVVSSESLAIVMKKNQRKNKIK